ncbi:MAG TPA: hypothetical protein VFD45_03170 [Patescibacteria group bacterium]|nr:hypothetical protein [Patescibacteria group bacterium]
MSEIGEQQPKAEPKTQTAEHRLTREEISEESIGLTKEFIDLFKDDPVVQKASTDNFFDYNYPSKQDKEINTITFNRGEGTYVISNKSALGDVKDEFGYKLYIQRGEGDNVECLTMLGLSKTPLESEKAKIEYRFIKTAQSSREFANDDKTVNAAKILLSKTQNDFGKS